MSANGISTLSTKQARQVAKLDLAQAKRKGQTITEGSGTWSTNGVDDDTKPYYKPNNTYDLTALPNIYDGNAPAEPDANPNPDGLLAKRPWIAVGVIAEPTSIEEAVDGGTITDLQIWYDGADTATYIPSANDEGQITQWTDKSDFAHNANPDGGNAKPTYENTVLQGGHGYLEFDGNDVLSINPFTALSSAPAFTIFIVGALGSTTGTQYFGSTNEGGLSIYSNGTNFAANVAGGTATGTTAIDTGWHVHTLVYDGTNTSLTYRLDKTTEATATPGSTTQATANTYYIGGRDSSTSLLSAGSYVGEVIMFSRALNATEYANVENYLSTKWGL